MALSAGSRLGSFEIIALLGVGGMGEVYRARDMTLNRDVAVKVLPEAFANDGDRLARFEREAQVLASLNHSNIAHMYGIANAGDVRALVMELVEGPTLAERLGEGPLPLDEAIGIGRQIAEALEAAHGHGVVHRDLKPANVKVRPDGTVKVLDFGLAKAMPAAGSSSAIAGVTQSPTITSPVALTAAGVILGTAAYMAPEQARGKPADTRADIWAFGCVLYEMLTGTRAFAADDVSDTLASILKSEPDWSALPADTPPAIRRVLRRCLEKDPKRRFHHVADLRLDLEEKPAAEAVPAAVVKSRRPAYERLAWAMIATSLAGVLGYLLLSDRPAPSVLQFQIGPPEKTFFGAPFAGLEGAPSAVTGSIAPDGTRLVFAATDPSGKTLLWVRPLDSMSAQPLSGTEGAALPFWSPDSRFIGFFVAEKLKRIDAAGGSVQTICDAPGIPRGGSWGTSGVILFSSGRLQVISRVPAEGGQPAPVTALDTARQDVGHFYPSFLPDGRHFLFWVDAPSEDGRAVHVGSIASGAIRRLVNSDSYGIYAAPGFVLYTRRDGDRLGTLMRQRLDIERLELAGSPAPVAERVSMNGQFGLGAVSASSTGVLTFRTDDRGSRQFAWFNRAGRLLETVGPPGEYLRLALSPDEKRLAFSDSSDVWLLDLTRQTSSRLTSGPGEETNPVWSADGTQVIYKSTVERGRSSIFRKNASGGGTAQLLRSFPRNVNGPSQVSPDGKWLLYFATTAADLIQDVYVAPLSGSEEPTAIVQSPFSDGEPQLSPDGKWLAYMSNETGRREVYVQPFPATGDRWRISSTGGRQPMWRADGKELFFVSDDRKFYVAAIRTDAGFDFGATQFLFDMRADVFNSRNSYVPSRDGQRFLVNMLLETAASPINVVVNWTAHLTQ